VFYFERNNVMNLLQKYINNGTLEGGPADRLLAANGDPGILRPFLMPDGNSYVTVWNHFKSKLETIRTNTHATLRVDDWKLIDDAIVKAAQKQIVGYGAVVSGKTLGVLVPPYHPNCRCTTIERKKKE